jgi:membrane protease YdiL (CAAX protease family)
VSLRLALELAGFAAVLAADAFGLVPLSLTVGLLPAVWLLMRLAREPWAAVGWSRPARLDRTLLLGAATGVAMELLAVHVTTPWISGLFGVEPDYSGFEFVRGNLAALAVILVLSWLLAAFGEEFCFRGFLMHRLARVLGGGRAAWVLALLLASVVFGWMHSEQRLSGAVQEGLSGLLLGLLYLGAGRNLVLPMVAHGTSNSLAFALIYLGRYPGQT